MPITQTTVLPLEYGEFSIAYHKLKTGDCLTVSHGDLQGTIPVIRIHSSCLFGESFHGLDCDCAAQLASTLKLIVQNGSGAVVYTYAEGRGIGLEKKIQALELQRTKGLNTVEAFKQLGLQSDLRTYEREVQALHELKICQCVRVAGQNPAKLAAIRGGGFEIVEQLHPEIQINQHNFKELQTKKVMLGYNIKDLGATFDLSGHAL